MHRHLINKREMPLRAVPRTLRSGVNRSRERCCANTAYLGQGFRDLKTLESGEREACGRPGAQRSKHPRRLTKTNYDRMCSKTFDGHKDSVAATRPCNYMQSFLPAYAQTSHQDVSRMQQSANGATLAHSVIYEEQIARKQSHRYLKRGEKSMPARVTLVARNWWPD